MFKVPQIIVRFIIALIVTIAPFWTFAQTITSVKVPKDSIYSKGQVLNFYLVTSEAITVTGTPYINLKLDIGDTVRAGYVSRTGTDSLKFSYTIAESNKDSNGITILSINLNGGTFSGTTAALDTTHYASLIPISTGIKIDAISPVVSAITFLGNSPTARTEIPFKIKFSRAVTGVDMNDFVITTTAGTTTATISSFIKDSVNVYRVLVSSIKNNGSIRVDLKTTGTGIKDVVGNSIDTIGFTLGTTAVISSSLTPTIDFYGPVSAYVGRSVQFFGTNFGGVSKIFFGNKQGLILSNQDTMLTALIMPGSDSILTKAKLLYGTDTLKSVENLIIGKSVYPSAQITNVIPTSNTGNSLFSSDMVINSDGNFAIVGGPGDNSKAGAIWMYSLHSATVSGTTTFTWTQDSTKITHPLFGAGSKFGSALAMDINATTVAVSAPGYNDSTGVVIIYKINKNISGVHSLVVDTIINAPIVETRQQFGAGLALSADGNTLMIGAPKLNSSAGGIISYKKTFSGWVKSSPVIKAPGGSSVAEFGSKIALSADGNTALVSAPLHYAYKGAAFVLKQTDTNWVKFGNTLYDSLLYNGANFGLGIAITPDAKNIFIGAPMDSAGKGSVYNYKAYDTTYLQVGSKWSYPTNDANSNFGKSIITNGNGDMVYISAPNFGSLDDGAFYVRILENNVWSNFKGPSLLGGNHQGDKINLSLDGSILLLSDVNNNVGSFQSQIAQTAPIYKSINHTFVNASIINEIIGRRDSVVVKAFNANSITSISFNDTTNVSYRNLTDSTVLINIDTVKMKGRNVLDLRYGVQHIKTDSFLIDLTAPTVEITYSTAFVKSGTYTMTLVFSEPIDTTGFSSYLPLLPNNDGSGPSARMGFLKEVIPRRVYQSTITPLVQGPITFFNSNFAVFNDTAGNITLPIPFTDTVYFDSVTIRPPAFTPLPNQNVYDSLIFIANLPETPASGSVTLTFTPVIGGTPIVWNLADRKSYNIRVKPFVDPTTTSPSQVLNASALLSAGRYHMTLAYQDYLLNPRVSVTDSNVNITGAARDSILITSYGTGYSKPNAPITVKGKKFTDIQHVFLNDTSTFFTILTDSTLIMTVPLHPTYGKIKFVNSIGDTSFNILNNFYSSASVSTTSDRAWLKINPAEMGVIDSLTLYATNGTASNISYVLEVNTEDINPTSANPEGKFLNTIFISDTAISKTSTIDAPLVFKFKSMPYVLNNGSNYYLRLRQIDHVGLNTTLKSIAGTDAGSNNAFVSLKHSYIMKSAIIIDTVKPIGTFINTNIGRQVRGPYTIDIIFREQVLNFYSADLILNATSAGLSASIDSVKTIIEGIQFRVYITPKVKGQIIIFNSNEGIAMDRARNLAVPLGADTVRFLTSDMVISDYTTKQYGVFTSGQIVDIKGVKLSNTTSVKIGSDTVPFTINSDTSLSLQIPFTAKSGKIKLLDIYGDSSVQVGLRQNINAVDSGFANNAFQSFKQTYPGIIDTISLSMQNSTNENLKYIVNFYSIKYDASNTYRFLNPSSISDTITIPSNTLRRYYNFGFKTNNLLLKDSSYYFRVQQINLSPTQDAKIYFNTSATGNGKVDTQVGNIEFTTNQFPLIYIDTVKPKIIIDHFEINSRGNAISNKIVHGPYHMIVGFNKLLANFYPNYILPALDSLGRPLVRIDSVKAREEGFIYEYFMTPLIYGNIIVFNDVSGIGIDIAGNNTRPLGYDTIRYLPPVPEIISYETSPVSAGRLINLKGYHFQQVTIAKISGVEASFHIDSDTTLTIEVPMHAGSGKIMLYNSMGDSSAVIDSNFNWSTSKSTAHKSWGKIQLYNTGILDSLKIKMNYSGGSTAFKFIAKIYTSDLRPSSINANIKFSSQLMASDTLALNLGASIPTMGSFTFNNGKFIFPKDSSIYFVIEQIGDTTHAAEIYYYPSLSGSGAVGNNRGDMGYSISVATYIYVDTLKPIGTLSLMQDNNKVYGKFRLILGFNKPIIEMSPTPVYVNPYNDAPKAVLDSIEILSPGLLYALHYTPKYPGLLRFQNPFAGVARDMVGNVTDPIAAFDIWYTDTTNKNIITANKSLTICEGDSLRLSVNVDSVNKYTWSNGATASSIIVTTAGKYAVQTLFDSVTGIKSDTIIVKVSPKPATPVITKIGDSLWSSVVTGIKWYRNDSLLTDTSKKIKPIVNGVYKLRATQNSCLSTFSDSVLIKSINVLQDTSTFMVNLNDRAIIKGFVSFCIGDSVILSVKHNSIVKYIWSTGATTSTIKVKSTGKYSVYIEFDSVHKIYSDTILVTGYAIPAMPTITRVGDTLASSALIGNTWYKNGIAITDTTIKIKPTVTNDYKVRTIQNGCASALSSSYYYLVTGIFDLSFGEYINMNPNPFVNKVTINYAIKGHDIFHLQVYEMSTGNKVYSKENISTGTNLYFQNLSAGIYLFNLVSPDGKIQHQFKMMKL